jgi:hypothetical protein
MRDAFVDVQLELNPDALALQADPSQYVLEASRAEAERLCADNRAQLRTDRAPEVLIQQGVHKLTRRNVLLVASRWAVRVPAATPMHRSPR